MAKKPKTKRSQKSGRSTPNAALRGAPRLGNRVLNAMPDVPDLRDRLYEPALLDLALTIPPPDASLRPVLNQGREGACTGFALASALTLMNRARHAYLYPPVTAPLASARMLYEMAKLNDEWPGEDYEGSSIRGALKGFFQNGVCSDDLAPYQSGETGWFLTKDQAKDARNVGLGAYYRLRPEIIDYHAALNETGVIYVSAQIHKGWQSPTNGEIQPSNLNEGGHAFIIIGYDEKGFLIQNSWGEAWSTLDGEKGVARWLYEDWAATVMDAWVLRLSVPTPDAFDLTASMNAPEPNSLFNTPSVKAPRHEDIIGHVIHLDDGNLVERGKYPTPMTTLQETANFLADKTQTAGRDYQHLLFYAHGGLNNQAASANRIRKMKEVFKRNGIYPIHFMWETGFFETLGDVIFGSSAKAESRVGGFTDFTDKVIEFFARKPGRSIWRDIKGDTERSFATGAGGRKAVKILLDGNAKREKPLNIHLVGHSAGAIFLGQMVKKMNTMNKLKTPIASCSLMAPACTIDFFNGHYAKAIGGTSQASDIAALHQYNLIDQREKDDAVGPYRKSLLYLVSRAFEDEKKMPILGMEKHAKSLSLKPDHKIHYAGRGRSISDSETHGGFDNDRATMNTILKNILGKKPSPAKGFQPKDMCGY